MRCHDIRRFNPCYICDGVGVHQPKDSMIDMPVVCLTPKGYAHPRCYKGKLGLKALLKLSLTELGSIRLCDIDHQTIVDILQLRKKA